MNINPTRCDSGAPWRRGGGGTAPSQRGAASARGRRRTTHATATATAGPGARAKAEEPPRESRRGALKSSSSSASSADSAAAAPPNVVCENGVCHIVPRGGGGEGAAAKSGRAIALNSGVSSWRQAIGEGLRNGLASGGAAACAKAVLQPFDSIKTVQQVRHDTTPHHRTTPHHTTLPHRTAPHHTTPPHPTLHHSTPRPRSPCSRRRATCWIGRACGGSTAACSSPSSVPCPRFLYTSAFTR